MKKPKTTFSKALGKHTALLAGTAGGAFLTGMGGEIVMDTSAHSTIANHTALDDMHDTLYLNDIEQGKAVSFVQQNTTEMNNELNEDSLLLAVGLWLAVTAILNVRDELKGEYFKNYKEMGHEKFMKACSAQQKEAIGKAFFTVGLMAGPLLSGLGLKDRDLAIRDINAGQAAIARILNDKRQPENSPARIAELSALPDFLRIVSEENDYKAEGQGAFKDGLLLLGLVEGMSLAGMYYNSRKKGQDNSVSR